MIERPILFSAPMVRAILDGRKTQTRRILKGSWSIDERDDGTRWPFFPGYVNGGDNEGEPAPCPYGHPGDRLRVKESCWLWGKWVKNGTTPTGRQKWKFSQEQHPLGNVRYDKPENALKIGAPGVGWVFRAGRYAPAWASRITLEVTGVRVERLQDISEADVFAEGVQLPCAACTEECTHGPDKVHALVNMLTPHRAALSVDATERDYAVAEFALLWDRINADRAPWVSNPWVWVVGFKRVEEV